eukprot:CAMPEP_0201253174 /NCGR_PEP_ID=MMETSP0852-20130820/67311_1 /ASSEMBLY_ACC=CAM_ASM_000632 /TAXON_ID=183588 /ORGANISM="Pseudo-nitzschia fraudulenta, Strain WWA7" /LENGTH=196 /DNA_ID=CAMNT_0047552941 /DNA_START=1020 /DNA_END=1610 /DNA_ORIENTATION=+
MHDTEGFTFDTINEFRSTLLQIHVALPPITSMFRSVRPSRQSSGSPSIRPATPADTTDISSNVTFRKRGFPGRPRAGGFPPYDNPSKKADPAALGYIQGVGPILPISIRLIVMFSMGPGKYLWLLNLMAHGLVTIHGSPMLLSSKRISYTPPKVAEPMHQFLLTMRKFRMVTFRVCAMPWEWFVLLIETASSPTSM